MFYIFAKSCLISISFFRINTMSSAYAKTFNCSLQIFIPLGTIFVFCITFCNAKSNNIGDRKSPYCNPVLFLKKDDSVPSILTELFVFCTPFLHIFINFLGIFNFPYISIACLYVESHIPFENQEINIVHSDYIPRFSHLLFLVQVCCQLQIFHL